MKYYALMKIYIDDEGWCLFGGWGNMTGAIFTDAALAHKMYREEHTYYLKNYPRTKDHPLELWEIEVDV